MPDKPDPDEITIIELRLPRWLKGQFTLQSRLVPGRSLNDWIFETLNAASQEAARKIEAKQKRQGQGDIPPNV